MMDLASLPWNGTTLLDYVQQSPEGAAKLAKNRSKSPTTKQAAKFAKAWLALADVEFMGTRTGSQPSQSCRTLKRAERPTPEQLLLQAPGAGQLVPVLATAVDEPAAPEDQSAQAAQPEVLPGFLWQRFRGSYTTACLGKLLVPR